MSNPKWSDVENGFIDTILHAKQAHEKSLKLGISARESMAVACSLAQNTEISDEVFEHGYMLASTNEVPGRGPITNEQRKRESLKTDEFGMIVRERGESRIWPAAGQAVVYLLFDDKDDLFYIGQTTNICSRIASHKDKPWRTVRLILCSSKKEAVKLEGDLIFQHQPYLNVIGKNKRAMTV